MIGKTRLKKASRIVIKIGSELLVSAGTGKVNINWLESLAQDIALLRARGQEVILVSSGAIALGRKYLGLSSRRLQLQEEQASAAAGMVRLTHAYQDALGSYNLTLAQVLLTLDDSENRRRYINARNTLETLLRLEAVPLINENDTVATDEIRFGDNDRLAARVAVMITADILIILSHVDGLYSSDPNQNPDALHIAEIKGKITEKTRKMASNSVSFSGSGGMHTKLEAAHISLESGTQMVIGNGTESNPITRIEKGARCTWFIPNANPRSARKKWIAGFLNPSGTLIVDSGALAALEKGRSLLPAGVISVKGEFQRGDAVIIASFDKQEVARGLVAYSSKDVCKIVGRKTSEIESILGYRRRGEIVHRDDLALS